MQCSVAGADSLEQVVGEEVREVMELIMEGLVGHYMDFGTYSQ